ncbi:ATPase, F0 complex, subunit B/B', bacterial/chloroplast [Tasmannia lanceolata]|uniref:ATPase, F0 complex, subunit B/B', bacterial/chloroplast n=1 Tax=Tasmannia lanceolata TaxID=3420 RepID=UPI004063113C
MANVLMASSKILPTSAKITPTKPPKQTPSISIPAPPKSKPNQFQTLILSSLKSTAAIAAAVAATTAAPAMAAEMEKAALFDFNLTLPAIVGEFLFLMVALDKIYYTPLGKFMDERDAAIREKLSSVKDTSVEVKQLEEQGAAVMKAARAEISAALNKMKKETSEELDAKLAQGRKKVEKELEEALRNLEKQKAETIKALDSQIAGLSEEIVKKVLPI